MPKLLEMLKIARKCQNCRRMLEVPHGPEIVRNPTHCKNNVELFQEIQKFCNIIFWIRKFVQIWERSRPLTAIVILSIALCTDCQLVCFVLIPSRDSLPLFQEKWNEQLYSINQRKIWHKKWNDGVDRCKGFYELENWEKNPVLFSRQLFFHYQKMSHPNSQN